MHIERTQRASNKVPFSLRGKTLSMETTLSLMVAPFVIFILVLNYLPLLGWSMAFVDYSPGISIFNSEFVGFRFFKEALLYTADFPISILNTFAMSMLGIVFSVVPVILAILISEIKNDKYRNILQTATSLPNFMSWVIVYSVAFSFFAQDDGIINTFLMHFNIISTPTNLLGNKDIVWFSQTFFSLWKTAGWTAIIYLGAIAGIDSELYEAARVDGAGKIKQIIHIMIPGIMPTFVVMLFLQIGWMLGGTSFEQIYVFHNALVHDKIMTLDYYTYQMGMKNLNFSQATAMGMFKTIVSIVLLFISGLASKKLVGRSII